ncbi:MAG: ABC transporter permease, partial [Oscillospiraceae bacterium]|nr:ABC transporter permease [Oscillospiraceae bacterium]
MKVFKTCLLIIKRRYMSLLLYFAIFIAISVVITSVSATIYNPDFSEIKPKFTVINRDEPSSLTEGIVTFLSRRGEEVKIEDRKDLLQDAAFYHATDYIIILPYGFRNDFYGNSQQKAETVITTESAMGYFADSLVNQYLNLFRVYSTANPDKDETAIADVVIEYLSTRVDVEKKQFGTSEPVNENYRLFARMTPYMLLILVILCVSNITIAFRRPAVTMRNLSAPISSKSMSLQQILCYGLMSLAAFVAINTAGLIQYGSKLVATDIRIIALILLNSFVFTIVAT